METDVMKVQRVCCTIIPAQLIKCPICDQIRVITEACQICYVSITHETLSLSAFILCEYPRVRIKTVLIRSLTRYSPLPTLCTQL